MLVLIGAAGPVVIGGFTGQILALVFISVGLVLATGLVFLEVGLSEDREREAMRARAAPPTPRARRPTRGPRHLLPRSDGHRRRL